MAKLGKKSEKNILFMKFISRILLSVKIRKDADIQFEVL